LPKRELPLGIVLDGCPNMLWLVKGGGGIRNWREFLAAAEIARPAMGISPSAWEEARTAMGEQQAAITIAAIYQRQDQINSAGGYLRSLTDRAKAGKFSVWPMVMALLRAKLDASKTTGTGTGAEAAAVDLETAGKIVRTESRLEISDALRRSLDKPGRGS
ncbi:replication initiation protein RepC, partial [Mesorhizobium sp.]